MTHASPCPIFDNAVTPLPKGKLATLVTYLALEPVVRPKPVEREHDLHFEQVTGQDYARYRAIFRQVGAPWLWFSRLKMAQAEVMAILDDPANKVYPMPIDAEGKDDTLVGRIRKDESVKNGISMWVVADNIRKGAALNAIQIAEYLIK